LVSLSPINFKIEKEGSYKFSGSYEYRAKLTDMGNSVSGRQEGKSKVVFPDGTTIEIELPSLKIYGLLYGKRVARWVDSMTFTDSQNLLTAKITFC
jgi:hypothetical protein